MVTVEAAAWRHARTSEVTVLTRGSDTEFVACAPTTQPELTTNVMATASPSRQEVVCNAITATLRRPITFKQPVLL